MLCRTHQSLHEITKIMTIFWSVLRRNHSLDYGAKTTTQPNDTDYHQTLNQTLVFVVGVSPKGAPQENGTIPKANLKNVR